MPKMITAAVFKNCIEKTDFVTHFERAKTIKNTQPIVPALLVLGQDEINKNIEIAAPKKCTITMHGQTHDNHKDYTNIQWVLSNLSPDLAILERGGLIHPTIGNLNFDQKTLRICENDLLPIYTEQGFPLPIELNCTERSWLVGMYLANAVMSSCDNIEVIFGENHMPDILQAMFAIFKYNDYCTSHISIKLIDSADTSIQKVSEAKPFPDDLHETKSNMQPVLSQLFEAESDERNQKLMMESMDPDQMSWNLVASLGKHGINPVKERAKAHDPIHQFLNDAPGDLQKKVEIVESCISESANQSVTEFLKNCNMKFEQLTQKISLLS